MTWIDRLKFLIRHFLAVQLREKVRRHTASALDRLDDRMLADIGVTRHRIAEYARVVAHKAVPVAPLPTSGRNSVLAQLRTWREKRAAIRELSLLDDRLLRDIGIGPGQIGDVVDAMLSRRRELSATHPAVQLSDAIQEVFVPARHRPGVPATSIPDTRTTMRYGSRVTVSAEPTPDDHALRTRAANENQSSELRRRSTAGL